MSSCCGGKQIIMACSGGSNVGQMSNDAAKAMDQLGLGNMSCLAGVGAKLPTFINMVNAEDATVIAIDGCAVGCTKIALENVGKTPDVHVVITDDCGVEKSHTFDYSQQDIAAVVLKAEEKMKAGSKSEKSGDCGCSGGCCG